MEATEGAIGFAVQKALLDAAVPLVPEGAAVCLMADRFYGTADLIAWCQDRSWDDRLRLKGNLGGRDAAAGGGPASWPRTGCSPWKTCA